MTIRSSDFGGGGAQIGELNLFSPYLNFFVDPRGREFVKTGVVYAPSTPADYAEALANRQCAAYVLPAAVQASSGDSSYGIASDKNLTVIEVLGSTAQRTVDGGQTWTTGIPLNLPGGYIPFAIATDGAGNWIAGGNVTSSFSISKSTDNGATWASVATPAISGGTAASNTLSLGWDSKNSLWVAAIRNTNVAQNIWTSPNGVTWTARAITVAFAANPLVCSSALGVVVFDQTTNSNYAYSINGTTYASGTLPASKSNEFESPLMFDTVAYSSGRGVYRTTDLVNWASVGAFSPGGARDPTSCGGQTGFDIRGGFAYGAPIFGRNLICRVGFDGAVEHFHVLLGGGAPLIATIAKMFPMANGLLFCFKDSGNAFWYRLNNYFTNPNALGSEGSAGVDEMSYFLRIK